MSNGSMQTIMIIDDTPSDVKILVEIFSSFNVNLTLAHNGETGLSLTETKKLDLILLDVVMPGMSGFEVCEKLKENSNTVDIPVIFITGQTHAVDEFRGFRLGAVDYIKKPYNPMIVIQRIGTHLIYAAHIRNLLHKLNAAGYA